MSHSRGAGWTEVDYDKAFAAKRLFDSQFAANRWLSQLLEQRGYDAFAWD